MEGLLIFIIIILLIGLIVLFVQYNNARKGERVGFTLVDEARNKHATEIRQLSVDFQDKEGKHSIELRQLHLDIQNKAGEQFQKWRQNECDDIRKAEKEAAIREAQNLYNKWIFDSESSIRSDAIQRSQSVIIGKVSEHLLPYMPEFPFNPKDVKFMGSPVDLIVFDGMSEGEIKQIVLIEIKTGQAASLTPRERQIRNIVQDKRVIWQE